MPVIGRILARYGPILEPRTLLCQRCLGVAYGNHPETVRQGWRRRQGKDNAEPSRRAQAAQRREEAMVERALLREANRRVELARVDRNRLERKLLRQRELEAGEWGVEGAEEWEGASEVDDNG
jgi:hypothetical protein